MLDSRTTGNNFRRSLKQSLRNDAQKKGSNSLGKSEEGRRTMDNREKECNRRTKYFPIDHVATNVAVDC